MHAGKLSECINGHHFKPKIQKSKKFWEEAQVSTLNGEGTLPPHNSPYAGAAPRPTFQMGMLVGQVGVTGPCIAYCSTVPV